jgi:hypothetical protein
MTEPLSCPYCNALVISPAGAQPGQRVPCARCGETFSLPASFASTPQDASALPTGDEQPSVAPPQPQRWPNALVAAIVVGGMMLIAALVLQFALLTKEDRRNNDFWPTRQGRVPLRFVLAMLTVLVSAGVTVVLYRRRVPERAERSRLVAALILWGSAVVTVAVILLRGAAWDDDGALDPVRPVAPAELEALRYLPGDTDLIAGVHVGELLESPESEKLLDLALPRLGSKLDLGKVGGVLARVEQLTGLRREVFDHVVLGAKLSEKEFGRVQLVVRTRKDYDNRRVLVALKATSHQSIEGRAHRIYRFHQELAPTLSEGLLSFPDTRTIVLGWGVTQLSDMPGEPHRGIDHLPAAITTILKERIQPRGQVWIAGHTAAWPKLGLALLAQLSEPDQQLLSKLKTFAVWFDLTGKGSVHAVLRCADAASAEAAEKNLADRLRKERLTIFHKDEWVTLQYRLGD